MNFVLSLFPGIDMLGHAFQLEGFSVVRGGDPIFGGDVRQDHYPPGKFDGIIGGPPCQSFSSLVHLVRANGHEPRFGNLIPEFERCVTEAQPAWFVMENVRAAPEPVVPGYGVKAFLLDNAMLDSGDGHGQEQTRLRRFTFGMRGRDSRDVPDLRRWIDLAVFLLPDAAPVVYSGTGFPHDEAFKARTKKAGETCPSNGGAFDASESTTGPHTTKPGTQTEAQQDFITAPIAGRNRTRNEALSGDHGVPPSVRDKIDKTLPPDPDRYYCGNCSEECNMQASGHYDAKSNTWLCSKPKTRAVCVTSTDGGERPSERVRHTAVNAGHDDPNVSLTQARRRKKAVSSSNGGNGGGEFGRHTEGAGNNGKGRYRLADACRLQGLSDEWTAAYIRDCPFTAEGKLKAVANGVPIFMGQAIAKAVQEALS